MRNCVSLNPSRTTLHEIPFSFGYGFKCNHLIHRWRYRKLLVSALRLQAQTRKVEDFLQQTRIRLAPKRFLWCSRNLKSLPSCDYSINIQHHWHLRFFLLKTTSRNRHSIRPIDKEWYKHTKGDTQNTWSFIRTCIWADIIVRISD